MGLFSTIFASRKQEVLTGGPTSSTNLSPAKSSSEFTAGSRAQTGHPGVGPPSITRSPARATAKVPGQIVRLAGRDSFRLPENVGMSVP